jgi:hypothetical protein
VNLYNNSDILQFDNANSYHDLERGIDSITKSLSRPYFNKILKNLIKDNTVNAKTICEYIIAEQTELNIKDSTKEGKIKILVWLSNFHQKFIFMKIMLNEMIL